MYRVINANIKGYKDFKSLEKAQEEVKNLENAVTEVINKLSKCFSSEYKETIIEDYMSYVKIKELKD